MTAVTTIVCVANGKHASHLHRLKPPNQPMVGKHFLEVLGGSRLHGLGSKSVNGEGIRAVLYHLGVLEDIVKCVEEELTRARGDEVIIVGEDYLVHRQPCGCPA